MESTQITTADINLKILSSEFKFLEQHKKLTPNMELSYQALITIKPSAAEAECQFLLQETLQPKYAPDSVKFSLFTGVLKEVLFVY